MNKVDNSIAIAPQHEEFYDEHLISILSERGGLTGAPLFRYYIDGRRGVAYSNSETALQSAKWAIDRRSK